MFIAILTTTVVTAACLAEVARRAYLGRRMAEEMQRYEPPSTVRILRTEQELQSALRRVSETERLKARQAATRADHYAAVADSVTASSERIPAIGLVPATA